MKKYGYNDLVAYMGIGGAHPGGIGLTREVLAEEKLSAGTKVLEVGCGTGQTAAYLKKNFHCDVTVLDRHPLMLKKAQNRFRREKLDIRQVKGDVRKIPFKQNTFDVVIAESVTIFTDVPKALAEYARVLKPGGILLDLEMTAQRAFSAQEQKEFNRVYGIKQVLTEKGWRDSLRTAGFRTIKTINKGIVSVTLEKGFSGSGEMPDMDPSENVDMQIYEIFNEHQAITQKFARDLGYSFYRAVCK